jgi:hypothetical protein
MQVGYVHLPLARLGTFGMVAYGYLVYPRDSSLVTGILRGALLHFRSCWPGRTGILVAAADEFFCIANMLVPK